MKPIMRQIWLTAVATLSLLVALGCGTVIRRTVADYGDVAFISGDSFYCGFVTGDRDKPIAELYVSLNDEEPFFLPLLQENVVDSWASKHGEDDRKLIMRRTHDQPEGGERNYYFDGFNVFHFREGRLAYCMISQGTGPEEFVNVKVGRSKDALFPLRMTKRELVKHFEKPDTIRDASQFGR